LISSKILKQQRRDNNLDISAARDVQLNRIIFDIHAFLSLVIAALCYFCTLFRVLLSSEPVNEYLATRELVSVHPGCLVHSALASGRAVHSVVVYVAGDVRRLVLTCDCWPNSANSYSR